jgi:hypothetical protein
MKSILGFFLICFTLISVSSQTLEFSQVKLVSTQETVPAGKVWKVEGVNYSLVFPSTAMTSSTSVTSSNTEATMILNGQSSTILAWRSRSGNFGSSNLLWEKEWPMWIPAGSSLEAGFGVLNFSVIEFTVVP